MEQTDNTKVNAKLIEENGGLTRENEELKARISRAENTGTITALAELPIDQLKQYCADIIASEHKAIKKVDELSAHVERLREGIWKSFHAISYCAADGFLQTALAETPAASLEAVKAEVWEKCFEHCGGCIVKPKNPYKENSDD